MSRPIKPITPMLKGGYSERLTKRVPRKKIITEKITKDGKILRRPFEPIKYNKPYLSDYDTRLIRFRFAFENKYGFNIFKTKGEELHVFLPMTSMSPQGYLLKAFFEQTLPKARVTFLVTPNTYTLSKSVSLEFKRRALNNLENNIRRSLNIHDKYFVCFDYIESGNTQMNIMQALKEIYNKDVNYLAVKSPVGTGAITHTKKEDGSSIRQVHSNSVIKKITTEHYNAGIELSRRKNFLEKLLK